MWCARNRNLKRDICVRAKGDSSIQIDIFCQNQNQNQCENYQERFTMRIFVAQKKRLQCSKLFGSFNTKSEVKFQNFHIK